MDVKKPRETVKISVRNLVEFILRTGDLDNRKSGFDKEAMVKGTRIHKKIQKQMGPEYRAEMVLYCETSFEEFILRVEGRADGIIEKQEEVWIDEIKGVYMDLEHLDEPVWIHKAQAMCYGYMYAREKGLEKIGIQMTYCNLDTEEIRRFQEILFFEELKSWYEELLQSYYKWADFQRKWKKERNLSMVSLEFPFPYRKGQREIVAGVYHTLSNNRQLFVQAPTGIGKTMSSVFPAVRAIGEGYAEKLFYLTAKTVTATVAGEAFARLRKNGLKYKTVTITAKEKLCILEEPDCNPQSCPYAQGHFDRINEAVYSMWTAEDDYSRERILYYAEKYRVCPFELCLDVSIWSDGIICDYNYVFDPKVYLKRFFGESKGGEYYFLIDEAHNLVERGRQMYSAQLYKEDILEMKRLAGTSDKKLNRYLDKVNRHLLEYKRECETYEILPNTGSLTISLTALAGELEKYLEELKDQDQRKKILEFYFQIRSFLDISELVDENYVIYTELEADQRFKIKLFCVNPALNLQKCLDRGRGTVFFSATLLPMNYYREMFSTRENDYAICAQSPFEQENRLLLIGRDVSSRYTRRGYREYEKIAGYIYLMCMAKSGNYMVFFPSYRLMQDVYEVFIREYPCKKITCVLQSTDMSEAQREEFLERFTKDAGIRAEAESLVGFCIMGGIFSEGIDLAGESLIGVAVVGTGLPQISNEREILKYYYDKQGMNGFDYAYRYPGMNKVLQAAGRVIRTREDRGIILLLDERFQELKYKYLFPSEWYDIQTGNQEKVKEAVREFWG